MEGWGIEELISKASREYQISKTITAPLVAVILNITKIQEQLSRISKPDFHLKIISREILHSSNLIGFAQFSAKKVENISTFF